MSTRGHSTIDRIVSATLEERERKRDSRSSSVPYPYSRVFFPSLPSCPFFSFRTRLFSRSFFERLSIDFPPPPPASVDESNAAMCIARTALSSLRGPFLVPFIDGRCFDPFTHPSASLIRFSLPVGTRFGFQDAGKDKLHNVENLVRRNEILYTCKFYTYVFYTYMYITDSCAE